MEERASQYKRGSVRVNVTMGRVRLTIVAGEIKKIWHILSVCL